MKVEGQSLSLSLSPTREPALSSLGLFSSALYPLILREGDFSFDKVSVPGKLGGLDTWISGSMIAGVYGNYGCVFAFLIYVKLLQCCSLEVFFEMQLVATYSMSIIYLNIRIEY